MRIRIHPRICATLLAFTLLVLVGCEDGESRWDTAREVAGAQVGDRIQADQQWNLYRDDCVRGLDEMKAMLVETRNQTAIDERSRVDALTDRIAGMRRDMVAELDESPDRAAAPRRGLRTSFDNLRSDVDSFLIQLGHGREEFAKWE